MTTVLRAHRAEELNLELGGVFTARESEEDEGDEMEYSSWRHEQDEITGSNTTERSFAREFTSSQALDCNLCQSYVGPTCSILAPPQHTQNRDVTMHDNTNFFNETTTSTSFSCSQIAPPPNYPWTAAALTALSSLSSILSSHKVNNPSSKSTPRVNLLVAVLSQTAPKAVGQNRVIRAEWKVVDQSGVEIGVVLWGETAESWCEAVQVGDVIYLGGKETPSSLVKRIVS